MLTRQTKIKVNECVEDELGPRKQNKGKTNGKRHLVEEWIEVAKMSEPSTTQVSKGSLNQRKEEVRKA